MTLSIGEIVHVPSAKAGLDASYPFAMVSGRIVELNGTKIKISLPRGEVSIPIAIGLARKKLGILIVQIGDMATEETLLIPLRKSILQYTRLLLSDDFIKCITVRSTDELGYFWKKEHALISHVVLIGHGSADSIQFGENKKVLATELGDLLKVDEQVVEAKQFISLCCKTGGASFGKIISTGRMCEVFIGPSGVVHAANASQFYQSYLAYHLLSGYKTETAYDYARVANPGLSEFNLWRKKQIHQKRSKKEVFAE